MKSKRELARRLNVSHAAVIRAAKDQRISPLPDGTWDVDACRAAWDRNTRRTRRSAVTSGEAVTAPAAGGHISSEPAQGGGMLPAAERATVEVPAEATAIIVETLREAGIAVAGEPTLRDTGVALEIMRGMKAKLEVDRLRGRSVDKTKAHDVLTTHQRTIRNDLLAWPKDVAPTLAHELGLGDHQPLEMALDAHLRARLEQLASLPPPDELFPAPSS